MHLFFQIQNLQLLILCMYGQEFLAVLNYVFYVFFCNVIKCKHFCIIAFIFFFVAYYVFAYSICICFCWINWLHFLSLLEIKAILLISSVITCLSLINFCYVFNVILLFFTNSFRSSLKLPTSNLFFSK